MNAAQRRKAARKAPQVGDLVEWRDMRIGWLRGRVLCRLKSGDFHLREVDGRTHRLPAHRFTILQRFVP